MLATGEQARGTVLGNPFTRSRDTKGPRVDRDRHAGGLVLLGAVLALTIHPYFAAIAAFVGAGLVFTGVTDTCGTAALLAKMPWNRS